jgi:hedgehog interacting protein
MKRWETYIEEDMVKVISSGVFEVQSSTGKNWYIVTFGDNENLPKCTCQDWMHNNLLCKHFCACMKVCPIWSWDKLSLKYTQNPLFCLDETIIPTSSSLSDDAKINGTPCALTIDTLS